MVRFLIRAAFGGAAYSDLSVNTAALIREQRLFEARNY